MRDGVIFEFIARLIERKFRFLLVIVGLGLAGIVYAHGWSWTTAMFSLVVILALGFGCALATFWISVFRNAGRQEEQR
jgi:hypothetical protein